MKDYPLIIKRKDINNPFWNCRVEWRYNTEDGNRKNTMSRQQLERRIVDNAIRIVISHLLQIN